MISKTAFVLRYQGGKRRGKGGGGKKKGIERADRGENNTAKVKIHYSPNAVGHGWHCTP